MSNSDLTLVSEARITTSLPARRYLGQLCKHFQHKLPVTLSEDMSVGHIEFSAGACELSIGENDRVLVMRALAANAEELGRVEGVVGRHLERFAFREDALALDWKPAA